MLGWLTLAGILVLTNGHSWLTCTDYLEQNGEYWDSNLCRAFPRHASYYAPKNGLFGLDKGYDNNGPSENQPCKTLRNDASYDSVHPMAVYYPGQKVVLTHPTKNHVADTRCTNKYIPDHGNYLYMGPRNHQGEVTLSTYKKNEIYDFGTSPFGYHVPNQVTMTYPKPGFQNAPKFCENMDKALGTYTWTMPKDVQPGRYSFLWTWNFNGPRDTYTGCFEADVVATKAERDAILSRRGQTTAEVVDVAQGGKVTAGPKTNAPVNPTLPTRNPSGPTPVDGGWGKWSDWSACSVTCGGGKSNRVRHCDSPLPQNGGRYCSGSNEDTKQCNTNRCPTIGIQDMKMTYTSFWGDGANGQIDVPNPKPAGDLYFTLNFPCVPQSVFFWHAEDVSTNKQKEQGVYVVKQSGWMLQKSDIGFTIHFGSCTFSANEVVITLS